MSNREIALQLIKEMPDEKIASFLNLFLDDNTLARMEADALLNDDTATEYSSPEEILEELLNE